jgi:hypothetical protein
MIEFVYYQAPRSINHHAVVVAWGFDPKRFGYRAACRNDGLTPRQPAFASASGLVTRTGLPSRKATAFSTLCG